VRVAMCGTCGTDLKIQAHPFPNQPPFGEFTPGHEWTGTVVALGETVDELHLGDRVASEVHKGCGRCENCVLGMYTACLNYGSVAKGHRTSGLTTDGGFAEYVVHHVTALFPLPDNVSWEDAVLVTTAGTGLYGLDAIGGYVAGDTVVVIGPGPVGLMTVQLCKALGAERVILVGTRQSRLELGASTHARGTPWPPCERQPGNAAWTSSSRRPARRKRRSSASKWCGVGARSWWSPTTRSRSGSISAAPSGRTSPCTGREGKAATTSGAPCPWWPRGRCAAVSW